MTSSLYCSKYHENPPGSRFCRFCGEALSESSAIAPSPPLAASSATPASSAKDDDTILGMRYRIIRQLGQGGFGRTYLAEDLNRFCEHCVLKEFVPQVSSTESLEKAEELFQREAGVLYQLQHPQIPRFRELLRVEAESQAKLYLVQDYIPGSTYRDLLKERQQQGRPFTETEGLTLLRQLLPVLQYLHGIGVIHRDIAPDNLILRETDSLPVLIDFGGVKQIAAQVEQQLNSFQSQTATRLGKVGYAPDEQMQSGIVSPSADLYALGVTILVLLTGKEPLSLYDPHTVTWHWQQEVQVSPTLARVLDRLIAYRPSDRYQSAAEVIHVLGFTPAPSPVAKPSSPASESSSASTPPRSHPAATPTTEATVAVSPRAPRRPKSSPKPPPKSQPQPQPPQVRSGIPQPHVVPQQSSVPQRQKPRRQRHLWQPILFLVLLIGTCASIWLVWWLATQWNPEVGFFPDSDSPENPVDSDTVAIAAENDDAADEPEPSPFSPEEQARKNRLSRRRSELGLSRPFYIGLVDQQFYAEYPEQRGKTLSDQPEDADWRRRWDDTAAEMLDLVDEHLSSSAREGLGTYGNADRDRWRDAARAIYVSDRALYDLADAQFVHIFAEQPPDEALDQPLGQIWHGLALDRLASLESGERLQTLDFEDDSEQDIKNRLEPGEGQVYIMDLSDDQEMKVRLDAPDDAALLSIYPPVLDSAEPLLDDSSKREWSGDLSQNGYYEIVVVSQTDEEFEYELKIEVND